ncbi:MAG: hypothetical protein FJW99_08100 [Actinobacteria bacterium]|nr:hypothetical protein [Actinomycetota bacterium]
MTGGGAPGSHGGPRGGPRRRLVALAGAVVVAVPLLSGCSARLSQFVDVGPEGGGTLSLELRLDPAAQQAIDLPRQVQEGTFERFLDVRNERWRAPGDGALAFQQRTEASGTVVLRSVRSLKAGTSQLDDLKSALGVLRPLQPILAATGRYWAAPNPGKVSTQDQGGDSPATGTAPGGAAQAGITGLPARAPLQTLLVDEFTPQGKDRGRSVFATFSIASRGGVSDVLNPPCNGDSRRLDFTRADRTLQGGLQFAYTWAMPSRISLYSTGGRLAGDRYVASWAMPYGQCQRMEISSAGSKDGRVVNGIILGAAVLFLGIVFALRAVSRRSRMRRQGSGDGA